jgi:Arc/MetJ family transcription regulator
MCMMVYMSRTNIDIDDELVAMVMERYDLRTKRDAVNFALKKAIGNVMTRTEALAMEGVGWEGDLSVIRGPMKIEQLD